MSAARQSFFQTIAAMRTSLGEKLLIDQTVGPSEANTVARILRNGIVISSFALMESFLENRIKEHMYNLSTGVLSYSDFDVELREFIVAHAVNGLSNRVSNEEKANRLSYAEQHVISISAYAASPPIYTEFGFSPRGSNVSAEHVEDVLKAFGLRKIWSYLSSIANMVGVSRIDLKQDFINCGKRRHRAAHEINYSISTSDLESHLDIISIISVCFDLALTHAVGSYMSSSSLNDALKKITSPLSNYRFLDADVSGHWVERTLTSKRAIKRHADQNSAIKMAIARNSTLPIIVRDLRHIPIQLL